MSKLIVEMEMPKRCIKCGVRLECKRYVCGLQENIAEDLKPLIVDKDCLIKGVLPDEHGDLIDRDALLEKHNMKSTSIEECLFDQTTARAFEKYCIIADALEAVPTVIAAERKDDGTTAD